MDHLFICGCPRSGTTAMWKLLSLDSRIILGIERYGNLFFKEPLKKEFFEPNRFLTIEQGDTFYNDLVSFNPYYENISDLFSEAQYVGDKIPLLYKYLDGLFENIPNAKVIFLVRNIFDISASYEARANDVDDLSWKRDKKTSEAINDWRLSLKALEKYIEDDRVIPVVFEDFFSSDGDIEKLYNLLGLECNEKILVNYNATVGRSEQLENGRKRDLSIDNVMKIGMEAPFGLYRELVKKGREKWTSIS